MAETETSAKNKHFLYPGALFISADECEITTVLGSCIAVCLWDQVNGGGGMNHFMLPLWNGEGLPTPRYGNIAMEKLLEQVLAFGARRQHLVAKVFGGANLLVNSNSSFPIGARNIDLALGQLEEWRIPVIASDVGGHAGRKIIMNTMSGVVLMAKGRQQK